MPRNSPKRAQARSACLASGSSQTSANKAGRCQDRRRWRSNKSIERCDIEIVDIVIDFHFTKTRQTTAAPKAVAGGSGMNITQRDRDLGTGYAMKPSTPRPDLTAAGRGTPMGELLRRYWHPVGLVGDATDIPRKLRVL